MSNINEDDQVFKALANKTRRSLLDALKDKPLTTGALCALFPKINRCTVMMHLNVLETADLVVVSREGRERWNHLNALPIKAIYDRWIGEYASHAVVMLDQLKSALEEKD